MKYKFGGQIYIFFLVHTSVQHNQLSKKRTSYLTKFADILLKTLFTWLNKW